ncbi:MAG: excinuclease ABC subunit UvrC [Pseudomonadota bacterium]
MSRTTDTRSFDELPARLREQLDQLPREPGVYLLKGHDGYVIYVGKAKNLYSRVRSYFTRSGDTRAFVALLSHLLADIEIIVTHNEKEALLLENNLIKEHAPRFNVVLRDDKNFLVLRLDLSVPYPRLEVTRNIKPDNAAYFGPYDSASAFRETLRLINRHFQLRTCTDSTMEARKRPCLQHQIGRCLAPCVLDVDLEKYSLQVKSVSLFLQGRQNELLQDLENQMQSAAAKLDFERAARIRDQIAAVNHTLRKQQVVSPDLLDKDVFAYFRQGDAVVFAVLNVRQGKLLRHQSFDFSGQEFPDEELLSSFINLYYDQRSEAPDQLIVPLALEDAKAKTIWLSEIRKRHVEILFPQRGDRLRLLQLAKRNAENSFVARRERKSDLNSALAKIQRRLRLTHFPRHIECYDVSALMGQMTVASQVVMLDGDFHKPYYRHFKIRTLDSDDFSALYEILSRRFRRAREQQTGWELPDLIVIDGGKGQLSMAKAALKDARFQGDSKVPDLIALAKERPSKSSSETDDQPDRVFLLGVKDALPLRQNTPELFLLSRIRDEAHRFAIAQHKKLRKHIMLRSELDSIPGIGPKRKRALFSTLGSLKIIRAASVEELTAVPTMNSRAAEAIVKYFAGRGKSRPDQ